MNAASVAAVAPVRAASVPGRSRRIAVIAREEYRRALETRWLFAFTALFAALVLGVSFFGLVQSGEVGFQGFSRVTLSLLNLVLFTVPLTGLVLGVGSVSGSAETLPLLLAQPVGRGEVLAGKYLGLTAALGAAQAIGFGAGGLIVALQAGPDQIRGFAALTAVSLLLGSLSLAAALALASILADRVKALAAAVFLWLLLVIAYDLAVLGATALLRGVPLQSVLFPALLLNPVDLARVLVTLAVGSGALFGPTSAVLVKLLGGGGGALLGLAVLLLETAVPLAVAARVFGRRDW
ncbi:MAG TPA: ABC transporter permease subunit [Candidatus Omnitrophota bacterium]|nr:ABC transporter permease subunit [Candidatus Omnitrophota bacterium]